MNFLNKIAELITGNGFSLGKKTNTITERQLIERESQIGRELFGEVPVGHSRDFFCLDEKTWVWHEEWRDENNKPASSTIRYEIQPKGILKVLPGRVYHYIEGEELSNLIVAMRLYYDRALLEIYGYDPATGLPLGRPAEAAGTI